MIRSISLLLSVLFISFSARAQNLTINWGEEFDSKSEIQKILGFADGRMVTYSTKGNKSYIETYSKGDMALLNTANYELPKINGKRSSLLNSMLSGNSVNMLLYVYKNKTRSFKLYIQTLDLSGQEKGAPKEIYDSGESDDKIKDATVDVVFSPDNSKVVVYFDRFDRDRTNFFSDNLVLDVSQEIDVISSSSFAFEVESEESGNIAFKAYHFVENDGSFTLIREEVEKSILKIFSFALKVGRYRSSGELIGETEIIREGMIFKSPTVVVSNGKAKIIGYYMNNEKGNAYVSGYSGIFVANFTPEMEVESLTINPFSYEFLKNVHRDNTVERMEEKGKELLVPEEYVINEAFVHSDGSITVLSEYFNIVTRINGEQATTTRTYGYVLFFKLDASGKLGASDAIRKMQRSSVTQRVLLPGIVNGSPIYVSSPINAPDKKMKYWSYAASMKDDNIYLVFNDHFKNQDDGDDDLKRALINPKKGVPYLATISANGDFEKRSMVDSGDSETYLVPQVTYATDDSEFVIWGIWKKANKFGVAAIE